MLSFEIQEYQPVKHIDEYWRFNSTQREPLTTVVFLSTFIKTCFDRSFDRHQVENLSI